jgi:hypothetical protein
MQISCLVAIDVVCRMAEAVQLRKCVGLVVLTITAPKCLQDAECFSFLKILALQSLTPLVQSLVHFTNLACRTL